ncbi:MAG TPA: sulfotransferase [Gammaproteobacteria bacterium]|nr:sulfotransferase [Gammaproteobacteria bacterium]
MTHEPEKARIWILGLLHSGTTIFWRAWRKDNRFLCLDEPLTGDVGRWFPTGNPKGTHREYAELFREAPKHFWNLYAPMEPYQELDGVLTAQQRRYLRMLTEQAENLVIDETHAHLHLPEIQQLTPSANVIHLYRRASGFATSHLLPSIDRQVPWPLVLRQRLGRAYRKRRFWERMDLPAGMGRDKVIGHNPHSKFGLMLSEAGYDAERIMRAPALARLLAYWRYHYHHVEREGARLFGERFVSLPYEAFATDASSTMQRLYEWIGMAPPPDTTYPDVHPPKPPYRPRDRRWREAARIAGFTDEEIEALL